MCSAPTTPVKETKTAKKTVAVSPRQTSAKKSTHPSYAEMILTTVSEEVQSRSKGITKQMLANTIMKKFEIDYDTKSCYKHVKNTVAKLVEDGELVTPDEDNVAQPRFKLSDKVKKRIKDTGKVMKTKTPSKKPKTDAAEKKVTAKSEPKKKSTEKKTPVKKTTTTPKKPIAKKAKTAAVKSTKTPPKRAVKSKA